jgi:hypothetical protein
MEVGLIEYVKQQEEALVGLQEQTSENLRQRAHLS